MTVIHDLHVDLLVAIFVAICARSNKVCRSNTFFFLLYCLNVFCKLLFLSENVNVRQWAKCANGGVT